MRGVLDSCGGVEDSGWHGRDATLLRPKSVGRRAREEVRMRRCAGCVRAYVSSAGTCARSHSPRERENSSVDSSVGDLGLLEIRPG